MDLGRRGQLDRTLVVFTSDQGLAVGGRHGLMGKQNLYEHFKSPLIVAGPGIAHGESSALVYLHDLYPTLCDYAEIATPAECDGASLRPVIAGEKPAVRDALLAVYRDSQRMARDARWKLLWYPPIKRMQLFDLENDPDELRDLSESPEHAERLREMIGLMAKERAAHGDRLRTAP